MNTDDKGKLEQNLRYLKENVRDLDTIIDWLIEKRVFNLDHRQQIESFPTPSRQINELIKILTHSPKRNAYHVFVDALKEGGYDFVVQQLKNTSAKDGRRYQSAGRFSRTQTFTPNFQVENSITNDDSGAAAAPVSQKSRDGCTGSCTTNVQAMLQGFLTQMKEERQEERKEYEQRMKTERQERKEFEQRMQIERKEYELRLEDERKEFEQRRQAEQKEQCKMCEQLYKDKQELLVNNDVKIQQLVDRINDLEKASDEYGVLKRKYEHLQETQKRLREKDNDRYTRLSEMTQEKEGLKKDKKKLQEELCLVNNKLHQCKEQNAILEKKASLYKENIDTLESDKKQLEDEISQKKRENEDLRSQVDRQCTKLLEKQSSEANPNDHEFKKILEQQNQQLETICTFVHNFPKDGKGQNFPKDGIAQNFANGGFVHNVSKQREVEDKRKVDIRNKKKQLFTTDYTIKPKTKKYSPW